MLRFFCALCSVAVFLLSCTNEPEHKTFKEKYNVYVQAELPLPTDFSETSIRNALKLMDCDVPIKELEDFADAIIRRMDAKTLPEYLEIQDQIDTLFFLVRDSVSAERAAKKYGSRLRRLKEDNAYAKDILLNYSTFRDETDIQNMVRTIQYMRQLHNSEPYRR